MPEVSPGMAKLLGEVPDAFDLLDVLLGATARAKKG